MRNSRAVRVCLLIVLVLCAAASARAQEFVYDSQGKRNPFIPLVTPDGRLVKLEAETVKSDLDLKLEGIIYDKYGISYAVVDGQVVKIGDTIGDYQVLRIEEKRVIFMREGQQKTVELKKEGA
ncbi:MAG: hypothetical protein ACM3OC_04435 [Deltaproteobacteria bacterium]